MPSGNAGLTTRTSTTMIPTSAPNQYLPVLVNDAETGSVAINIIPKAKPPVTKCQYQGIANIAFVSLPIALSSIDIATIPPNTPNTMRHEAIPL